MRKPFKLEVVKASELSGLESMYPASAPHERRWSSVVRWNGMKYVVPLPRTYRSSRWNRHPDIHVGIDSMIVIYYCRTRSLVILNDLDYTPEQLKFKQEV